jgi:hypothetical protein
MELPDQLREQQGEPNNWLQFAQMLSGNLVQSDKRALCKSNFEGYEEFEGHPSCSSSTQFSANY